MGLLVGCLARAQESGRLIPASGHFNFKHGRLSNPCSSVPFPNLQLPTSSPYRKGRLARHPAEPNSIIRVHSPSTPINYNSIIAVAAIGRSFGHADWRPAEILVGHPSASRIAPAGNNCVANAEPRQANTLALAIETQEGAPHLLDSS